MGTICSKARLAWSEKLPKPPEDLVEDPRMVEFELHFQNLRAFSLKKA